MINKIVSIFKRVVERKCKHEKNINYKNLEIYPDDVFLVSYPKSGNTWLRFLIGNYLYDNQCNFDNSHLIIPDIHRNPEQCLQMQRPRFIKSHFPFSYHLMTQKYPKVVYIVRDGRDVAVSYYYHLIRNKKLDIDFMFKDYILMFHQGLIDHFSNWNNHVNFWLDFYHSDFLLVKYEELKEDTSTMLSEILKFSGMEIDYEKINKAVHSSEFKTMQRQESERNFFFNKNIDRTMPFVRAGISGEWRNMFTEELHDSFLHIHGSALKRLSYI